jgi:DNA-binding XRE family transcriptional regulator
MAFVWQLDIEILRLKKQAKIERKLTYDDIAREIGVSRQTLYLWRKGVPAMPADSVFLAEYLGLGKDEVPKMWKLVEVPDEGKQGQKVAVA